LKVLDKTYILTAELDEDSFIWLDGLRRAHFPPERNVLPAHLTLFHKLSPAQLVALRSSGVPGSPIPIHFDDVLLLGAGVALRVASSGLHRLRNEVRKNMAGELSRQDGQPWKPHVTVQNKAPPEHARLLHARLRREFTGRDGTATALLLWEYLGGPRRLAERIEFSDPR
jgi:2'-5' RNA ligase